MILKINTDGGSKGNPGPSAVGVVIRLDDKIVEKYRKDIGVTTNNVAEYTAVLEALRLAKSILALNKNIIKIELFSDSKLLVNQLKGLFKIKAAHLKEYIVNIKILENDLKVPVSYIHIPREENQLADDMVNNIQ